MKKNVSHHLYVYDEPFTNTLYLLSLENGPHYSSPGQLELSEHEETWLVKAD